MSDSVIEPVIPVSTGTSIPSKMSKERRECHGKGKKYRRDNKGTTFMEVRFTGHTDEFKNAIYDITYNMSDQYTTTTRAIAEHVGRAYKNGSIVKSSIEELTVMALDVPRDPVLPNALELRIWEREVDEYAKQKNTLTMNLRNLYSLILGQVTPALRTKLRTYEVFNTIRIGLASPSDDDPHHLF